MRETEEAGQVQGNRNRRGQEEMCVQQKEQLRQEDKSFQYIMQDTSYIYLGARYSYQNLLEEEQLAFKIKTIFSQYILKEVEADTTLESHFYYMTSECLAAKTYQELKVRIKVSMPVRKKTWTGKERLIYKDHIYTLKELVSMNLAKKKQSGMIIREIILSKLGLLTFTV